MKLTGSYLFLVCLVFAAISCTRVIFLHPAFINKSNRVFKMELLGKWIDKTEDSGIVVTIDTALKYDSSLIYKISIIGKTDSDFGDSSYLDGELMIFSDKLFMMITTDFEHPKMKQIGLYNAAMIPSAYYFIRMFSITEDSIQIGQINGEVLTDLLYKKKLSLKHDIAKDDIFILERGNNIGKKLIELEKIPGIYEKTTYRRLN